MLNFKEDKDIIQPGKQRIIKRRSQTGLENLLEKDQCDEEKKVQSTLTQQIVNDSSKLVLETWRSLDKFLNIQFSERGHRYNNTVCPNRTRNRHTFS